MGEPIGKTGPDLRRGPDKIGPGDFSPGRKRAKL